MAHCKTCTCELTPTGKVHATRSVYDGIKYSYCGTATTEPEVSYSVHKPARFTDDDSEITCSRCRYALEKRHKYLIDRA